MPQRDPGYLIDIIEAAKQIQEFIQGIDKAQFENSSLMLFCEINRPYFSD